MRSSETSLLSGFSLTAPSADSCALMACSVSLCTVAAAGGGVAGAAAVGPGAGALAGAGAAGAGGAAWREQEVQDESPRTSSAVSPRSRLIGSTHALHVGSHVADLLRRQALGERQHHHAVGVRMRGIGSRVARAACVV